jgi:hypothetical protein
MFAGLTLETTVLGVDVTVLDIAGLTIAGAMIAMLLTRAAKNLRVLAEREPAVTARRSTAGS